MRWDPDRYGLFREERSAPFEDLLSLVAVRPGLSVLDLGCGTGELTQRLATLLPESDVLGIDASEEMLARARPLQRDGLRFERGFIEQAAGEYDLVISNASLHWVEDHQALLARLFDMVRPGGQLVAQVPANHDHPANRLVGETAREEPFVTGLSGWERESPVLPPEAYAAILYELEAEAITVFLKVYPHVLPDASALTDWLRGTTMLPYLERLPDFQREAFVCACRSGLRALWPAGPIFYPFKRILLAASRPEEAA